MIDHRITNRLAKSGIVDPTYIEKLGWQVVPQSVLSALCPCQQTSPEGAIEIFFPGVTQPDGSPYRRYRQLGDFGAGPKYLSPSGSQSEVYVPVNFDANAAQRTLFIAEGEIKSSLLDCLGYKSLGITGVANWIDPGPRLAEKANAATALEDSRLSERTAPHPTILKASLDADQVIVIGDSDLHFNHAASRSLNMLVAALRAAIDVELAVASAQPGYEPLARSRNIPVSLAILPPIFVQSDGVNEETPEYKKHPKIGIDDFFLGQLASLQKQAYEPRRYDWMSDEQYADVQQKQLRVLERNAGIECIRRVKALAVAALGSTETALAQQLAARTERCLATHAGSWLAYDEQAGFWKMLPTGGELKYPMMLATALKDVAATLATIGREVVASIPKSDDKKQSGNTKQKDGEEQSDGAEQECSAHIVAWVKGFQSARKGVLAGVVSLETTKNMCAILKQAGNFLRINEDLWDQHPTLFNCANCVIDLTTGTSQSHDASLLLRGGSPASYDPTALAPNFEAYLTKCHPDQATRTYLQTVIGYCMTGTAVEQTFWVNQGNGGNGKGTLNRVLNNTFGPAYLGTASKNLLAEKSKSAIPNDMAAIATSRLVTISEIDKTYRWSVGTVRSLTGGDRQPARFLNKEFFTFKPKFKLFLDVNGFLSLDESNDSIRRRVIVIPWKSEFRKEEDTDDTGLDAKLDAEVPGILNWVLKGANDYFNHGLKYANRPALVRQATNELFAYMDEFRQWIEECCVLGGDTKTLFSVAYSAYKSWRAENGHEFVGAKRFQQKLADNKLKTARGTAGVTSIPGFRLRDARDQWVQEPPAEVKPKATATISIGSPALPSKFEVM
jgi:P4 family phage/plasmid primase-like protien